MCGRISRRNRSTKSLSRKNAMGNFPRFFMCTIGMLSETMLWNPLKPAPIFIDRGIHAQAIIFVLLRRTLRSWRGFGMIAMQAGTAIGVPIRWMWSTGIWTVGICMAVLPGSNAKIAAMSFSGRFPVKGDTSAHLVIRSGWLNSVNGYAPKCSNPSPTRSKTCLCIYAGLIWKSWHVHPSEAAHP